MSWLDYHLQKREEEKQEKKAAKEAIMDAEFVRFSYVDSLLPDFAKYCSKKYGNGRTWYIERSRYIDDIDKRRVNNKRYIEYNWEIGDCNHFYRIRLLVDMDTRESKFHLKGSYSKTCPASEDELKNLLASALEMWPDAHYSDPNN